MFCFSELNPIENSTDNIATDTTTNSADKSNDNVRKRQSISLKDSMCSLLTLSMLVWMSILMLYFFLYLGTINTRLQNTYPDKVSHFTNVLAYTMFGGIVTAIIPGSVAEWQIKKYKDRKKSTERNLLPNILPMTTASLLALTLNVLSYFKSEAVFYTEFAVLTVFRSFLFSSNMSFVISVYPQKHAHVIYPLGMTVGGVTSTIQIGIFIWYNQSPEAQIYVKSLMTIIVALTLIHPILTFLTAKGVLKRKDS